MVDYKKHIHDFMLWCTYPEEAANVLAESYDAICRHPLASSLFHSYVLLYETDQLFDYQETVSRLQAVAGAAHVHLYTVQLLYLMCLARHARDLYAQKNIPDDVYRMSMLDFKWKLLECHQVYGIWGTFVISWFDRFFTPTRFALGRLQFELSFAGHTFVRGENTLHPGDLVVNMHIPSCGPLTKEACMDSFRQAEAMFAPYFNGRPVAFTCHSWLLYPRHRDFLPENSNIRTFMDFMTIVEQYESTGDLWRIFNMPDCSDIAALPRDTSLQRAYITMMESGIAPGGGCGYFFMKNGEILS